MCYEVLWGREHLSLLDDELNVPNIFFPVLRVCVCCGGESAIDWMFSSLIQNNAIDIIEALCICACVLMSVCGGLCVLGL